MSGASVKKRDSVIRFAVGSPEAAYSAVWNVATYRDDVYLAARQWGRWMKVSLHASGVWRIAWTDESKILEPGSKDRVIRRWRRPPEFRPGWTQGISVIVPWTPVGRHFPAADAPAGKPVSWVRPPAPGDKVNFTILFTAADVPKSEWTSMRLPGDQHLGRLQLQNGESVLVMVRRAPLEPYEKSEADKLAGGIHVHPEPGSSPDHIRAAILMMVASDKDGSPVIMNLALGPGNVVELGPRPEGSSA